ncbi:MAG: hypothetical protein V2I67_05655 [Thermoanaerobaculales bacterium]|nr:hypothetical protein [Thermoanaerobaculales bacterium]
MSRRNHRREPKITRTRRARPASDTSSELRTAALAGPFFRQVWNTSSSMTWQQFVDRWERRFHAPPAPPSSRR